MRKMKITSLFAAALLIAAGVSGCSDDNGLQHTPAAVGDAINFGVGASSTRTTYGTGEGADQWQLYWNHNADTVRLFCNQAQQGSGTDYLVVEDAKSHAGDKKWGLLQPRTDGSQMKWGDGIGEEGKHVFYAAYPGSQNLNLSVEKYADNYAVFKCPINRSQSVTLNEDVSTESNKKYTTTADMREAFMVASATGNRKTTEQITFQFKPIMTTLEVTVSRDASDNTNSQCTVTGLQIIANVPEHAANADYFYYKVPAADASSETAGLCEADGTLESTTGEQTTATTSTYVDLKTSDGLDAVDLEPGQSVTMTVFLPPVDNLKGLKIRVAGAGTTQSVIATVNSDLPASAKKKIQLPTIKGTSDANEWMTHLDDRIYVQQLSIPGAHDAAASSTTLLNVGRTQSLTPDEMFQLGIRAFDLRPAFSTSYKCMYLYHGVTRTDYSLNDVLSTLKTQLASHKGEFVILQLRHESEGKAYTKWNSVYNDLKKYDDIIVQWKPDLTIGECRGKMIIFTRDDYKYRKKAALVSDYPYKKTGDAKLTSTDGLSSKYIVQDYYQYDDDNGAEKLKQMKALYQTTKTFNQSTNNFPWALNHASGYVGSLGGTTYYMQNASYVNKPFYNYLLQSQNTGPTGIMFLDFVGTRYNSWALDYYTTYGDLLPAAIINQNYRSRLLRKAN